MKKYLWLILLLFTVEWLFPLQSHKSIKKIGSHIKNTIDYKIKYIESHKGHVAKKEKIDSGLIYYTTDYYAKKFNIDTDLILGLIIRESNVTQKPRDSIANCRGMCQISKGALSDFNRYLWKKEKKTFTWNDMYSFDKNIYVACYYLSWLWKNFDTITNTKELLQAYNVGPYKLKEYKKNNNFKYAEYIIARTLEIKTSYQKEYI